MEKKIRLGVVNWDAGLPGNTYFGGYMVNFLGHPEYAHRLPYYAKIDEKGNYFIPQRTQADYDEELQMAAEAGIDFFMYCWYPDGEEDRGVGKEELEFLQAHLPSLNTARKLYQQSPWNKRINMCAILIALHTYSQKDIDELVLAMKQDYYEKKDGRPLIFFFGGYLPEYFQKVKETANKEGLDPYVIFINNGKESKDGDYSQADAVAAYAAFSEATNFEDFCLDVQKDNERRKAYGIPVIPVHSAGWNPRPRVDRHCPWCTYADIPYAPAPTAEQMEKATLDFYRWIEENEDWANTGYGTIFAWNEFEEGGYICPTLGADGKPNTAVLDGLARAIKKYN